MIVLDTNILISAIIKDSITRKILVESGLDFAYPEISLFELLKHKKYILGKSGYSEKEFENIINKLLGYICLVSLKIIELKLWEAKEVMKEIDVNDTVFLAAALALNKAQIWSDDKDFDRQNKVRIIKTNEMIKIFEKQSKLRGK